jgi:hypothetical protein
LALQMAPKPQSPKPQPSAPRDSLPRLRQLYALLTPADISAVTAISVQLHDGDNIYAQSLTGALRIAQVFGLERTVLREIDFARAQPQLFNVFLGAALALALNRDMPHSHFETLISPLAAAPRFAWLKEVWPA